MTLFRFNGTLTLSDTVETNLFSSQTLFRHYATNVFLHNMVVDDVLVLRIYNFDNQTITERLYDSQEFKGVQDDPDVYIPFIPSEGGYRVTAQRTSSSNITITWDRYEAS